MNIDTKKLTDVGLNIFLSVKVSDIPSDLFTFSPNQREKYLILLGAGGKTLWKNLPLPIKHDEHPIDKFTLFHIKEFSKNILQDDDIEIIFPNDHYLLPLQQLGRFFNLSKPSPIGIDISEEFGLWFAYRGAFLTSKKIPSSFKKVFSSSCEACSARPCLIDGRISCPYKIEEQYSDSQIQYHASQPIHMLDL
ncbi:MAG: hypothetical protein K2Q18_07365 [Bdellovibrionales bacterium]|nr:hypothetical protein [Bdellovibrionales bacterium]